jgi:hypothetical protein
MSETSERLRELLQKVRQTGKVTPEERAELIRAQDLDIQTGPEVGAQAPDFTLPDSTGRPWHLPDLLGPQGLLLVFHRSADW